MVRKPLSTSNVSSAALYRVTEKWGATMLVDEYDSFGKEGKDLSNVLKSSHIRNKPAIRCHPTTMEPEFFRYNIVLTSVTSAEEKCDTANVPNNTE